MPDVWIRYIRTKEVLSVPEDTPAWPPQENFYAVFYAARPEEPEVVVREAQRDGARVRLIYPRAIGAEIAEWVTPTTAAYCLAQQGERRLPFLLASANLQWRLATDAEPYCFANVAVPENRQATIHAAILAGLGGRRHEIEYYILRVDQNNADWIIAFRHQNGADRDLRVHTGRQDYEGVAEEVTGFAAIL